MRGASAESPAYRRLRNVQVMPYQCSETSTSAEVGAVFSNAIARKQALARLNHDDIVLVFLDVRWSAGWQAARKLSRYDPLGLLAGGWSSDRTAASAQGHPSILCVTSFHEMLFFTSAVTCPLSPRSGPPRSRVHHACKQ